MNVCVCCGKSFVPVWNHPSQKYCSGLCQDREYRKTPKRKEWTKKYAKSIYCKEYWKNYHQTPRGKEVSRRACKKYRMVHKKPPAEPIEKKCVFCGKSFVVDPFHPHAKFCSKQCYWKSDEGKKVLRNYYYSSGKDVMLKYQHTPTGRKILLEADKKYHHSPKRKEYLKQYRQSPNGIESFKKVRSKRRGFKHIYLMPNVFPKEIKVEDHHLINVFHSDKKHEWFVIPMPKCTHRYILSGHSGREHWRFNADWISRVFCLDVKGFLSG